MQENASIKVWDISVRLFHWVLVVFFSLAYITGETETLHAWVGYIIIGLLIYRIVWGLIGTKYACFANFIYSPAHDLYKEPANHPSQALPRPQAGWRLMVILLIAGLTAVSWTGLKAYEAEGKGPLAAAPTITLSIPVAQADDDWGKHGGHGKESDEFWKEAHEATVYFMLLLIGLHLGGVAVSSLVHRENLARAMITDRKRLPKK